MDTGAHSSKNTAVAAAVTLVIGLLVGFGITKAMDNNDTSTNSSMANTSAKKAADLRSSLVTMGVEHMIYTDQAVNAALDGSANADATGKALYANGTDLGAAVGSVYGKDAEATFNSVWKLHLDEFVKYAVASKQGDETAKAAALSTIDSKYTKPLAQYLAKANPNLPENALESGLRDHVQMTAKVIDLHVAGDYTAETAELNKANDHIASLMSTLAEGIVKQYPSKF